MQTKINRGFTLIELLVVIAIIGILSAVVLASLGTARSRGQDAGAKQNLSTARTQAELFYWANGNSYNTVCTANSVGGVKSIKEQILAAAQAEGLSSVNTTYTTSGNSSIATCHNSTTGWGAEVPLRGGGMFCVDSTNIAAVTAGSTLGSSDVACN